MPGRQSTGPPSLPRPKAKKRKTRRALNALAIAEKEAPTQLKARRNRLGESEAPSSSKRRREPDDEDEAVEEEPSKRARKGPLFQDDENVEIGSDSSGNEWMTGQVDEDDDSELDSDEAMGESDEERFEGYTFRGSSSQTVKPRRKKTRGEAGGSSDVEQREIDLDEGDETEEEDDDFGDEGVDLVTMLDEEPEDKKVQPTKARRRAKQLSAGETEGDFAGEDSQDEEESMLSVSDSESEAANTSKLESLQNLVSSMNQQDKHAEESVPDALESMPPSEYGITSKRKLTAAALAASIKDPQLKKSLKMLSENESKSSGKRNKSQKLEVPLPKRQQDRIDRTAAYEKSKETLNRWIDTVKHNRRAEHLSFPLQDPDSAVPQGQNRLLPNSHSKPFTDLESTIKNILQESGLTAPDGQSDDRIRAFEELKSNKLPVEEVLARREELRKRRDLLFREEIRAKRIKKIKSKRYRKVHRKERERTAAHLSDTLRANGEIDSEEEKERNDRRRAEERMGAKHRESKWAKGVKYSDRMKWDEDAREGIVEMARRGEELKRRIEGKDVRDGDDSHQSSESEEDSSDVDQQTRLTDRLRTLQKEPSNDETGGKGGNRLESMDFMRRAEASRRAQNDADAENLRRDLAGEETSSDAESGEGTGRKSYGPQRKSAEPSHAVIEHNEFEEREDSDVEDKQSRRRREVDIDRDIVDLDQSRTVDMSAPNRHTLAPKQVKQDPWKSNVMRGANGSNTPEDTVLESPGDQISQQKPLRSALKGARAAQQAEHNGDASLSNPPQSNNASLNRFSINGGEEEEDGSEAEEPVVFTNAEHARRAFAGDEKLDQRFHEEKDALTKEQDDQIIDNTMPGWGSWTGIGVSKRASKPHPRQRKVTKVLGIAPENRKDAKLKDVIISEKKVKKNGKYLASQLPHPFETRAQYERSLRLPVGPEWTTKETFQGMTKPRVLMKQGVIAPMVKPIV
ncbi:uncharacterized protein KY384_004358 [Bacidia gigantensis]|uniref:uncharacterized protein n=1 Tax=Bacidia gigantensis TaxID=2732470 RepID=UPI001D03CF69|nr:uncharacterized protein KY384_004358 [Bacidia gigantensis]KAG8531001.1 hypothetical protein KY384_004358 [Bacidia gigantensis]